MRPEEVEISCDEDSDVHHLGEQGNTFEKFSVCKAQSAQKRTDLRHFCSYVLPILVCTWRLCERAGGDQQRLKHDTCVLIVHLLRSERHSSRPFSRLLLMVMAKPGSQVWTARAATLARGKLWSEFPDSSKQTNRTTMYIWPLWYSARIRANATSLQQPQASFEAYKFTGLRGSGPVTERDLPRPEHARAHRNFGLTLHRQQPWG